MAFVDLSGRRYSRLTVESRGPNTKQRHASWLCRCDCGVSKVILAGSLVSGKTRSCGCLQVESRIGGASKGWFKATHGQSGNPARGRRCSPEYKSWAAMKSRCNNPNATDYHLYGGRGIKVCDPWNESFETFFADMGKRPGKLHCIDRIDNNRGYFPGNCRWATQKEQQSNRRNNRIFVIDGERLTASQAAEKAGIPNTLLHWRLRNGWPLSEAFLPPRSLPTRRGRMAAIMGGREN